MDTEDKEPVTVISKIPAIFTKKDFADLFKQARFLKTKTEGKRIIQADVAKYLSVEPEYICKIEGGTSIPANEKLEKFAEFFGSYILSAESLIYMAMCLRKPDHMANLVRPDGKVIKGHYEHLPNIRSLVALMEDFEGAVEKENITPQIAEELANNLLGQFRTCVQILKKSKNSAPTCDVTDP